MEELGIELVGRRVVDLGPFHGAIVHQAKVGVDGQVRERVGGGGQPIEELLQMGLGNVADACPRPNEKRQRNRQILTGPPGDGLQILDEFHPIRLPRLDPQPVGGEPLHEDIRGVGILQEAVHRKLFGPAADSLQQLAEVRREFAVVEETGLVRSNGDRILLRAAFRLIPMGNEADNLPPDFGLRYRSQHVQWRHAADDTKKSRSAQ